MSIIASNARVSVSVRGLQVTTLEVWAHFPLRERISAPVEGHKATGPHPLSKRDARPTDASYITPSG
ncbi:hypothetical protein MESS2_1340004 [Mesorhizobium metallidurans STM 2683]|uniref:Uncharacterized protein n=1 Tax=Mesorhizobium metallidurans STM 2683 TaxID=1297569 RepID=M5EYD4_9HYPH|nr:hypothetical protein MESS2_1340004 [Mesorhizobium metallidurans STM 2683]